MKQQDNNKKDLKDKIDRAAKIHDALSQKYPEASCSLEHEDPLQLLISTQLAAQCTDARVNIVTQTLFVKYKTVEDFAGADIHELEEDIKSTGFYHNKAKNIIACCKKLVSDYGGKVPDKMEELLSLAGVGRKTANVVLGDAFGIPGIVIDTHAGRLSRRMGLTEETDPVKVEFELMEILDKSIWTEFGHRLVYFGRDRCKAINPDCSNCEVGDICPRIGVNLKKVHSKRK